MATIILIDWREGLEKVSLTKLQNELLEITLFESKKNVDKLLEGETVRIEMIEMKKAVLFIEKAKIIGAICEIEGIENN